MEALRTQMAPQPPERHSAKLFDVLEACAAAAPVRLAHIAAQCGLPLSTTYRLAETLVARGYMTPLGGGLYGVGTALLGLTANVSIRQLLEQVGRPIVARLAQRCRTLAHMGIMEGDMVTYLVKQPFGRIKLHSAEGMQLEAYCSAIGKILLAGLAEPDLRNYMAQGAFIALTPNTIVNGGELAIELATTRRRGWAVDNEEIAEGLRCVAVAIYDAKGEVCAALSVSARTRQFDDRQMLSFLPHLHEASLQISATLFRRKGYRQPIP